MAFTRMLIRVAIIVVVASPALAKEHVVGDEKGWTTNFDYEAWAAGKDFLVGDKLIFKYKKGAHNVFRVTFSAYLYCAPAPANEALTTGNDVITLTASGKHWYICGIGNHCEKGNQKLFITVYPLVESPASSTSSDGTPGNPTSAATTLVTVSKCYALLIAAFGLMMVVF